MTTIIAISTLIGLIFAPLAASCYGKDMYILAGCKGTIGAAPICPYKRLALTSGLPNMETHITPQT